MDECYCGDESVYSRKIIEQIAAEQSCDAIINPDFCETGTFVLSVDVWLNIQRGICECVPFDNDARTLRLYWNEHPIDTTVPTPPRANDASSFLLSVAALTSVLLAAFIFAVLKCRRMNVRRRATRRRVRVSVANNEQPVTESYPDREQTETSGEHIELSSSTTHVPRLSDRPEPDTR